MNDLRLRILDTIKLSRIRMLRFDDNATAQYEHIKHLKTKIGTLDLRIAAIVLANNGVLITDIKLLPAMFLS